MKSQEKTNGNDVADDIFVVAAEQTFERLVAALNGLAEEIKNQKIDAVIGVQKTAPDLNKAVLAIISERRRLHETAGKYSGVAGGTDIDLDRARDEIRLRLACLRDAADPDGVLGGAE